MREALIVALLAGCGDNVLPRDPIFVGASGERLKLQWYLYKDGARLPEPAGFYDARLHMRCAPQVWTDGVMRCTPLGDPTVFVDPECTTEVGRKLTDRTPKHVIRYERAAGELRAAGVFATGDLVAEVPATFFELRDGTCTQIPEPTTAAYLQLGGPIERERMVDVWSELVDNERLALRVLASAEGLVAPIGFHDRELGFDCDPARQPDGTSACEPAAVPAQHFADPLCEQPVVLAAEPPVAVEHACRAHAIADEHASLVFRREGGACVQARRAAGERAFRVGEPLPLAPLARTVDADPLRRLQRVTLATGALAVLDATLHDTATRSDCRSYGNGELAVCVPTSAVAGRRVYANDRCGRELLVAELPRAQCAPSTFAVVEESSIHAIGAPYTGALYTLDAAMQCRPKPVAPDRVVHTLGPAIPIDTFVGGVVFSER